MSMMNGLDVDTYVSRSRAFDLTGIAWDDVPRHPLAPEALRVLRYAFYFHQAARRLARPRTARPTRLIVERFWAPVGTGVQPDGEVRFLARYLLSGADGREAARKIDETIQSLPGLAGVPLMEAWLARTIAPASGAAHIRTAVVEPERLHALALLPRA